MKTQEFTGHSAEMKDPTPWLAAEDIEWVGSVKVMIERIYHHKGIELQDGRTADKYAVQFKDKKKQLLLNSTNRKALREMFGTETQKWIGQEITLYFEPDVKFKGQKVGGIRIRGAK